MPSVILDPGTRSPGKLALVYGNPAVIHQLAVNFINGVDLNDSSAIRVDANELASTVAIVLPNTETIQGFKVLSPTGVNLYQESFGVPYVGSHVAVAGYPQFYSPSLTIPGNGVPTSLTTGSGRTKVVVFARHAYAFTAGEKRITAIPDLPLSQFIDNLHTNLRYFADFYGQHAEPAGYVDVQF